jgi:hypothetical protein
LFTSNAKPLSLKERVLLVKVVRHAKYVKRAKTKSDASMKRRMRCVKTWRKF